jgi:pyruvate/2-oxoglutarate dehydrogenase complex dihydrolipoamide acyltransferase (E2) component
MSSANSSPPEGSIVPLSYAERWFVDGFSVIPPAGGIIARLTDMTKAKAALQALRARGLPATWTHIFVRAAALALKRYPEAHMLMAGYKRLRPTNVDIGLSVAGRTNYAPVMLIPSAEEKPLPELVGFINDGAIATREKEERDLEGMNRLGWIIPFGPLRRMILRLLGRSLWFRRRLVGTFQVSCLPTADFMVPMGFYTGSLLSVARVCDRVIAVDGQAVVRPTTWLIVCMDHKVMDGRIGATLLDTVVRVLESDELLAEAGGPALHEAAAPQAALPEAKAAG